MNDRASGLSVRQHATDRSRCQKLVRDAAEDPFAQAAMSIAAGDDQIRGLVPNEVKEFGADRPPRPPPHLARRDNAMPPKIFHHIGKTSFGMIVRLAFVDSDDEHMFGLVQKRKSIAHGAAALARP